MENQNSSSVRSASIRLSTVATTTRQTPKTDFGTVMRDGLIRAGNVAVDGLRVAAPFVPGSAIISAALAGANIAQNVGTPSYGGTGGGSETGFASSASGLSSAGNGPASFSNSSSPGNYAANGSLSLPGRRPGLETNLSGNPASAAGSAGGGQSVGASDAFNNMMGATRQMAEF